MIRSAIKIRVTLYAGLGFILVNAPALSQGISNPSKAISKTPAVKAVTKEKDPAGADVLILRDGSRVLGQVYDGSPRNALIVFVRRAWVEANLPGWAEKWKKAEALELRPAENERRQRLLVWRQERQVTANTPDRILAWIDRELTKPQAAQTPSALMAVRIPRSEVKTIDRRGMIALRALRLGWTMGFKDVETMPLADLNDALAGRGLVAKGETTISLDELLPIPAETEAQWLRRRAATEVLNDEGSRFVRFGNTVMSENAGGQRNIVGVGDTVLSDTIKDFMSIRSEDPMLAKLRTVTERGRVGAMVTRLDLSPDMESVVVESVLYIRLRTGEWTKAVWRSGTIRSNDVAPGAVDAIADDPQVKSLFGMIESFGFGGISSEMKRKSLVVGAMTRKALGLARSELTRELARIALPIDASAKEPKKPDARP